MDKVLQKPLLETHIFNNENVNKFFQEDLGVYSILMEKSNLFKNDELFDVLKNFNYYRSCETFLKYLKSQEKIELFLEAIYFADKELFEKYLKNNFDFKKFPNFVKKYRNFYKKEVEKKIFDEGKKENDKYKELSFIKNTFSEIKSNNYNQNYIIELVKYFIFDHLTTFKKLSLYNLKYEENLDNEYLTIYLILTLSKILN